MADALNRVRSREDFPAVDPGGALALRYSEPCGYLVPPRQEVAVCCGQACVVAHAHPNWGYLYISRFSSRTGSLRMRWPVAWKSTLQTAALVPKLPSSPRPLTPAGLIWSSCSLYDPGARSATVCGE